MVDSNLKQEVLVPEFLLASKAIYDTIKIPFGTRLWQLLLLADGYASLSGSHDYSQETVERFLHILIRNKKPIIIDEANAATTEIIREFYRRYRRMQIIEVKDLHASVFDPYMSLEHSSSDRHVFAILPHKYIRRRVLHQHAQEYGLFVGQNTLTKQSIHIIGIAPIRAMLTQEAIALMVQAPLIVTFDFVYELIKDVGLQGELHILEYDWEKYQVNIDRINQKLSQLHIQGYYDITLIVEGNPEVYDLLSYLGLAYRSYRFEVIAPAVVLCCAWITQHYGIDITKPSYVIISGYHARHGITTQHLALELEAYLRLDITCLIIELYSGDLPLIFKQVFVAKRPKTIVMMMNMFTDEQQIFMLSGKDIQRVAWAERIKGKFTSIAIVDQERLQQKPSIYTKLLKDFAPDQESSNLEVKV